MADILRAIADYTAKRVAGEEAAEPFGSVRERARAARLSGEMAFRFERKLAAPGLSLICEVKKASPSKGIISEDFPYLEIARDYEVGGADCVSCLTEPHWFLGSAEIFSRIRREISLPMLRKDFTVSPYQVYQARLIGADAVLIIMSITEDGAAAEYFAAAEELGMTAVFECRDVSQIERAQRIGARVIGVNNRNLRDFSVDPEKAAKLRAAVAEDRIFVSESGVMSLEALRAQREAGADACLVGEFCMRAADRVSLIREMKNV